MFLAPSIKGLIALTKCESIAITVDIPKVLVLFPVMEPINKDRLPKIKPKKKRWVVVPINLVTSTFRVNMVEKNINENHINKHMKNILVIITNICWNK